MSDLKERLKIMADMISLCEKISWGSDSAIMRDEDHQTDLKPTE